MNRKIFKETLNLAAPMASARLFNVATTFLSILIISQLSETVLAASALISSLQAFIYMMCFSFLTAISVSVGYVYGAQKFHLISKIFQQGIILAVFILIPIMLLCWYIGPILILLHQKPTIVAICVAYFHTFIWSTPPFIFMLVAQQLLLAMHQQKFVFYTSGISFIIAPIMAYAFALGHFGFPQMGVAGLGLSYVINNIVLLIFYIYFLLNKKSLQAFKLFKWHGYIAVHFKKLLQVGWPIAMNSASDLLAFVLVTVMVGWLGQTALIAQQVSVQYMILLLVPLIAIASSSGILVSRSYGEKDTSKMQAYNNCSIIISAIITVIFLVLILLFHDAFIRIFLKHSQADNSEALLQLTSIVLIITIIRQFFDAIMNVSTGSLRGLFDTKYPMIIAFVWRFLIQLPFAYFVGFTLGYGIIGISITAVIINLLCAIILWRRWQKKLAEKRIEVDATPSLTTSE